MIDINEISEHSISHTIKKILMRKAEVIEYQDAEKARYDHSNLNGTPQFKRLLSKNYYRYVDNLIPRVIDAVTDRLEVDEFVIQNANKTQMKNLESSLKKLKFEQLQKQVHNASLRDGSCYLICQKSVAGEITVFLNTADIFEVIRDEDNPANLIGAVKFWKTCGGMRLNIYYADRVERYFSQNISEFDQVYYSRGDIKLDSFDPYTKDGYEYIQKHGFDKLPVFAFVNNPDNHFCGISELVSLLPIQKTLNTSLINLLIASEAWALPTRYLLGFQAEYDKEGQPIPLKIESGGTWVFGDGEIKIGQLEAADLTNQLAVMNDFRVEMSRLSGVPLHLLGLSGDYPSGESLKVAERSLIGKVKDRQVQFSGSWEAFIALVLSLEIEMIDISWCDPAPISQLEESEICLNETKAQTQKLANIEKAIELGILSKEDLIPLKEKFLSELLDD